jgi:hypothetical protein
MRLNMIPTLVLCISILLVDNGLPNSQFETDNRVGMRGLPRPSALSISGHLTAFSFACGPGARGCCARFFGEMHKNE